MSYQRLPPEKEAKLNFWLGVILVSALTWLIYLLWAIYDHDWAAIGVCILLPVVVFFMLRNTKRDNGGSYGSTN